MSIPFIAAAALLVAAFVTDVRSMKIPNRLTVLFFASGCLYKLLAGGLNGGASAAAGVAAGALPLLLLYMARGIGAGDVKLFGALGAWIGAMPVLHMLMYSILYAGAIGVIVLMAGRPFAKRLLIGAAMAVAPGWKRKSEGMTERAGSGKKFPFMLAVAPAALTVWLLPM